MTTTTRTAGEQVRGDVAVGDVVTYTDTANAPRTYVVTGDAIDGQYELTAIDANVQTMSDCRQAGWTFADLTDRQVHKAPDAALEAIVDSYTGDENPTRDALIDTATREQDARALWNDDDARVRESVGNYRP